MLVKNYSLSDNVFLIMLIGVNGELLIVIDNINDYDKKDRADSLMSWFICRVRKPRAN